MPLLHLAFQLPHVQTAISAVVVTRCLLRRVDFQANVEATCMQAGALRSAGNTFYDYPCTDFEGFLKDNKDFTATIVRVDPYTGSSKQKAYIALSGAPAASAA